MDKVSHFIDAEKKGENEKTKERKDKQSPLGYFPRTLFIFVKWSILGCIKAFGKLRHIFVNVCVRYEGTKCQSQKVLLGA